VYKSNREPSINLIVTFNEQEKQEVLAALSRFGINYKQSEIHVRQPTAYKIGYIYPDGSYVTTTFDIPLKAELTETQIKEIVQDTEVIGFSTTPTTLTTYWVRTNDDKTDAENFNEFRERVGRVHELVGDPSLTIGKRTQRLSVFGGDEDEESNAIASYKDIGGDVRPKKASDTETARLIAEYVSGGPIKVFTQKPLSRKIENQQILMAQVNEEVPINDLKKALVRKCYQALAKVLKAQFAVLPIKVELTVPPKRKKIYSNSAAMRRDVSENNTLKIFATTPDSFGPEGSDFSDHPLLQPSGFKDINKKPLLYNDLLRAVHDYFAHNVSPAEFGPAGEYAAWANHMGSISDPYARWALTAETRMQNAWQNFREGVEGVSLDDRGFSLQKAALPPISLTYTGDEVVDAPMRELENSLTDVQKLGSIKPTSLLRKAALEGKAPSKEVPIPKLVPKFSLRAPNTPKFKRFFGDSKIVDENNQPRVMYHGTARDITTFKGKQANAIFLTDSPSFAEDFSRMSEDWMIDHRYDFFTDDQLNDFKKQADAIANKTGNYADDELRKLLLENLPSNANIMPLYVRAENPFDYDDPAQVTALLDQLRENGVDVTTRDRGASIQEGLKVGRWHEVEKPEVQEAIKQLGHDAFYVKEGGIKNLAVYDPSQVKSATGNTGEFSRDNPDIRYSLREELENNADEIAAMDKDVRENTKYQDLPGGYPAYTLYEARKVMPKKESTIKRVTYSNTDILYQYSDGVANVDGNPYLVTKQENPDFDPYDRGSDEDAQTSVDEDGIRQSRYVWAFEDPADPNFKQYETAFFDIPSAIEEFKQHLSSVPKYSMRGATVTPKNVPFVLRDSTILDNFMYSVQDNLYDLKTALDEIKKMGIAIKDSVNPYEKEQLFHNRAAYQNEHFINHELKPLLQKLAAFNISTEKLEEYLHARHAETRNKAMAAINPGQPDGLSGMTTAEAKKILANYTPNQLIKLQNLGRMVDSIMKKTREVMVAGGLETQQTIDNWDAKYPDYVPLYREDVDLYNGGQGAGFSIAGATSKRAIGSTKGVKNILANIVMQRERVIGRAERNRVSNSMYGLAIDVPNADFWMAVDPDMKRTPQSQAILEAQLVNMGLTPADAAAVFAPPKKRAIDNKTGLVTFVRDFNLAKNNNVLVTRVNGKDKYVIFNPKDARALRLVGALKNLDAEQMGAVMSNIAKLTRYFASMQTQYNPAFGLFNFLRDIQGAMLNLSTTPLRGKGRRILSQSLPAMLGIYNDLRNERKGIPSRSKWSQIYEEFGSEGGPTGFRDMFLDADSRAKAIQSELSAINDGTVKQIGKGIFNWLSDFNSAVENSIRLVAYSEAIDMGMSKQKAAVLAKNITVNFNKSGAKTQEARALYAFFNASVQGTTKVAETLRGPMGRRIVFGGMLIGMMQAMLLAASGFEDDEPPDEIKDKSLIIPTGDGTYKAIPMPQGFNVIPGFARRIFELAMSDDPNVGKALISMTGMFANAFNPIGNAGLSIQTIAPTVVDPFVALAENKDFNGRPISRLDFDSRDPTPGFTRAKDNASAVGSAVSEMVNFLSGGDKYTQGAISPTPDAIDYLIGQAFGGVGKEGTKLMSLASSIQDNEELPSYKIPMVGRFFGNLNEASAVQARFYENIKQMNKHQREIEGREQDELDTDWYYAKFPEAALYSEADSIARDVSNLRKQVREMKQTGESPEDIKGLNEEIVSRMNELNEAIKEERANRQ
jgi:hypothetical protein